MTRAARVTRVVRTQEKKMNDKPRSGFFWDDGTAINPDLISKPSLCVSCRKDEDPNERILCTLTRADQQKEDDFQCHAFEPKA